MKHSPLLLILGLLTGALYGADRSNGNTPDRPDREESILGTPARKLIEETNYLLHRVQERRSRSTKQPAPKPVHAPTLAPVMPETQPSLSVSEPRGVDTMMAHWINTGRYLPMAKSNFLPSLREVLGALIASGAKVLTSEQRAYLADSGASTVRFNPDTQTLEARYLGPMGPEGCAHTDDCDDHMIVAEGTDINEQEQKTALALLRNNPHWYQNPVCIPDTPESHVRLRNATAPVTIIKDTPTRRAEARARRAAAQEAKKQQEAAEAAMLAALKIAPAQPLDDRDWDTLIEQWKQEENIYSPAQPQPITPLSVAVPREKTPPVRRKLFSFGPQTPCPQEAPLCFEPLPEHDHVDGDLKPLGGKPLSMQYLMSLSAQKEVRPRNFDQLRGNDLPLPTASASTSSSHYTQDLGSAPDGTHPASSAHNLDLSARKILMGCCWVKAKQEEAPTTHDYNLRPRPYPNPQDKPF